MRSMLRLNLAVSLLVLASGISGPLAAQPPSPGVANFEGSQTNPIRLSVDRTRLFAVNTANSSLSVFDVTQPSTPKLIVEIPVGLEPVSVNSRTNDEVWVVNQASDSVSIVSVSKGIVTDTINIPDEPSDVVFPGNGQAYVSCARNNQIAVFNVSTHASVAVLPVLGGNPRALAVGPNGSTVYAAFALAGNATTIIPDSLAPPQPPPTNVNLPPPPQVGLIVAASDPTWSSFIRYTIPANGVVAINTGATPSIKGYYGGVGTVNLGLAVNPVTGDLFVTNTDVVTNTDALNLVHSNPTFAGTS